MDAIDLLIGDHNRVKGLFTKLESADESGDTEEMARTAMKILDDLEVHATIEEELFYPSVHGASEEVAEIVDEGVEEHHVVKILMDEVRGLDPASDEWKAKMKVIMENVEHHVEEEENEMFPGVRKSTEASAREELGSRMEARKAELGAPTTADADGLSKTDLVDLAKEQEIPGRSTMSQEELAATVDARGNA